MNGLLLLFVAPAFFNVFSLAANSLERRSHLISDLNDELPRAFARKTERPNLGRALAPAEGNRLARKVLTSTNSDIGVGKSFNIWINVTDNSRSVTKCTWKSPEGVLFPVQTYGQGGLCSSLDRIYFDFDLDSLLQSKT